jgi:hypothetical protein
MIQTTLSSLGAKYFYVIHVCLLCPTIFPDLRSVGLKIDGTAINMNLVNKIHKMSTSVHVEKKRLASFPFKNVKT